MDNIASTAFGQGRQFTCPFCGKGYDQKSRIQRHIETAHPPSAPSAADVERVLKGIKYPKTKDELFEIAMQRISATSPDLWGLIDSLPNRNYRDSAEVAIALGELKSRKRPRSAAKISKLDAPNIKGGRRALESRKISASRIAKLLKGINFPKSKKSIILHVSKQRDSEREKVISILSRISSKKYQNLIQVQKEVSRVK